MSSSSSSSSRYEFINEIESLTLFLQIYAGKDLVGKDRSMLGRRTTSDPYVKVYLGGKCYGHNTKTIEKNLNPVWEGSNEAKFKILVTGDQARSILKSRKPLRLVIMDEDDLTEDDLMGVVDIPIPLSEADPQSGKYENTDKVWHKVSKGEKDPLPEDENDPIPHHYCHNAKGKLQVSLSFNYKTKKMVFG